MAKWKTAGIALALAAGWLVVLAGPAWLLWDAIRPEPWNAQTLVVKFESVRYDEAGLVFRYTVENRTSRLLRFLPGQADLRVLQKPDVPEAGRPSVRLPLSLEPRSENVVEVRLEIRMPRQTPGSSRSLGQDWVGVSAGTSAGERFEPNPLDNIDGFELTEQRSGARIVFPRVW